MLLHSLLSPLSIKNYANEDEFYLHEKLAILSKALGAIQKNPIDDVSPIATSENDVIAPVNAK